MEIPSDVHKKYCDILSYYTENTNDMQLVVDYLDFFKEHPYMLWGEYGIEYVGEVIVTDIVRCRLIYNILHYSGCSDLLKELLPHFTNDMNNSLYYYSMDNARTRTYTKLIASYMNIQSIGNIKYVYDK